MAPDDDPPPIAGPPCAPCRGSGSVRSNLGGQLAEVACPWCEGGGVALPAHDAQARRRDAAQG